ncbi:acyl-CoA synthetase [Chloroflexus aggregans]|uniref:AMP-dependent synthetase and ligase n=1 Tax=Chloroflexus aggregans (strain MD-66 / DSM 9485) TaxID=326427 RepID=B8GB12_CHLAD|nr:acyl-CoA synthetase [Chloroflexus aggregans]ACL26612.1 AMP-dependent synthetase and ligase [Chloroflexus aggregans DSM 9485]
MSPLPIVATLLHYATTEPLRPCVVVENHVITYRDLAAASAGWATRYRDLGIARGDRVALALPNSPAFLAAYFGAQLAGAAVVLVNPQYRHAELSHLLADAEPLIVVATDENEAILREAMTAPHPHLIKPDASLCGASPVDPTAFSPPAADDMALIAYTSGTTGRAKGAIHTHASLAANCDAVIRAWRWTEADRLLLMLPLFHVHGLGVGVHGTIRSGASLELHARFDAELALQRMADPAITLFFGVPTMYVRLIEAARQHGVPRHRMRLFVSGSAPLSPQTFADFADLFGQPILERYGMTETGMNLTNPYEGERRPGSVGMPFPGQEARIVDRTTRQPLPAGEVGEIQVRGPHLFRGYWRNPSATAAAFTEDGWFNTGDVGFVDTDGYVHITGRSRELIISGGYNIYPREVEEVLAQHPAVAECAVYGQPDPDLGEVPVADVVIRSGIHTTAQELIDHCRQQLAAYKRPRQIRFVTALPRNAMGKVQRHLLGIDPPVAEEQR